MQVQGLTKAVKAALYELIQAGSTCAGWGAGALQSPADILGTGTCISPPLDQFLALQHTRGVTLFPERERYTRRQIKRKRVFKLLRNM